MAGRPASFPVVKVPTPWRVVRNPARLSSRKAARTVSVTPTKRLQVEQVKARYYEKRELNPGYSLLSITRQVFEDGRRQGLTDGFNSLQGLNARAVREIKREDNGLPAF